MTPYFKEQLGCRGSQATLTLREGITQHINLRAASLADAQVIALQALNHDVSGPRPSTVANPPAQQGRADASIVIRCLCAGLRPELRTFAHPTGPC